MSLKSRYFFLKSRYIYEITFLFVSLFHVENLPSFLFFSWVLNTQPYHWTKWMVRRSNRLVLGWRKSTI